MRDSAQTIDTLRVEFHRRYGVGRRATRIVHAPYRVCPLGAHIDHQLGPVTAMAIDRGVTVAFAPSGSREVVVTSLDFPGTVRFALDAIGEAQPDDWGNFPRGAALALLRDHDLQQGMLALTAGRLDGGGLSSSAAIGVALLLALQAVNGLQLAPEVNVRLHSRIENDYLGLQIGVLDQAAVLFARRGSLARIDCGSLEHELIPYPESAPPFTILLAFSGLQQALVGTDYNRRVSECRRAARQLLAAAGRPDERPLLGRVTAAEYQRHRHALDSVAARRAAHFFGEVARVEQGVNAWRRGDLREFGRLMSESGASSIANYQCGCPPLVDLYRILLATPGIYGARFSGAGFRGCCVALAAPDQAPHAAAAVQQAYQAAQPPLADAARVISGDPDDGARMLEAAC